MIPRQDPFVEFLGLEEGKANGRYVGAGGGGVGSANFKAPNILYIMIFHSIPLMKPHHDIL